MSSPSSSSKHERSDEDEACSGKRWTEEDDAILINLFNDGATKEECKKAFPGRTCEEKNAYSGKHWSKEENETLINLFNASATKEECKKALPGRNWNGIQRHHRLLLETGGLKSSRPQEHWLPQDKITIVDLFRNGATKEEFKKALPDRTYGAMLTRKNELAKGEVKELATLPWSTSDEKTLLDILVKSPWSTIKWDDLAKTFPGRTTHELKMKSHRLVYQHEVQKGKGKEKRLIELFATGNENPNLKEECEKLYPGEKFKPIQKIYWNLDKGYYEIDNQERDRKLEDIGGGKKCSVDSELLSNVTQEPAEGSPNDPSSISEITKDAGNSS